MLKFEQTLYTVYLSENKQNDFLKKCNENLKTKKDPRISPGVLVWSVFFFYPSITFIVITTSPSICAHQSPNRSLLTVIRSFSHPFLMSFSMILVIRLGPIWSNSTIPVSFLSSGCFPNLTFLQLNSTPFVAVSDVLYVSDTFILLSKLYFRWSFEISEYGHNDNKKEPLNKCFYVIHAIFFSTSIRIQRQVC